MYVPMPVLAAVAIVLLVLAALAWRRRAGDRDLVAPPRAMQARTMSAPDLPPELADEVRALARAGRKIEAIKEYRRLTGANLVVAKREIEYLMNRPTSKKDATTNDL